MVELFEGVLGGGKSYTATVRIASALSRGRIVVTNIEIHHKAMQEYVRNVFGVVYNPSNLVVQEDSAKMAKELATICPRGPRDLPNLVVFDEAHLFFNSRDWKATHELNRDVLTFITQSRKLGIDLIFITQKAENLDSQFRRMVQYIWRFRDFSKLGAQELGISFTWFKYILSCQFDYDGKTLISRSFDWRDDSIFKLYNSDALPSDLGYTEEVKSGDIKSVSRKESLSRYLRFTPEVIMVSAILYLVLS